MAKIIKNSLGNFLIILLIFAIAILSIEEILRISLPPQIAYANTAGPNNPSTESQSRERPYDDESWEDEGLGYLGTSDNTYVQYTGVKLDTNDYIKVLYAGGFGFNIEANSTINGITVEIERHCSAGAAVDALVQLTKSGVRADENKSGAVWTGDLNTYYPYGGSGDKWSQTWTVDEANNIGVALAVQATQDDTKIHVDHIKITIDFTPPAAPTLSFSITNNDVGFGTWPNTNKRWANSAKSGAEVDPGAGEATQLGASTNSSSGLIITVRSQGNGAAAGLYKSSGTTHLIEAVEPSSVANATEGYAIYGANASLLTVVVGFAIDGTTVLTTSAQTFASASGTVDGGTVDVKPIAGITSTTPAGSYADTLTFICTGTF